MLLRTLAPSLLGNALAGRGVIRAGEGTITTSKSHPLINFETQIFSQNGPKLNGVYSRHNLYKKKAWGIYHKS